MGEEILISTILGIANIVIASIGIDKQPKKSTLEDIDKQKTAFGWYIFSIIVTILLGVSMAIYTALIDCNWGWSIALASIAIISSSLNWDFESRRRTDNIRSLWIYITCILAITLLYCIHRLEKSI